MGRKRIAVRLTKKINEATSQYKYTSLGFYFVAAVLLYWYLGTLADDYFQTKWIQIIGLFIGITAGSIKLYYTVRELNEKPE